MSASFSAVFSNIAATSLPTTGLTGVLQAAQEPAHTGGGGTVTWQPSRL